MVHYNIDQQPGLPWNSSGMNATVVLDQRGHVSYTNLDEITGKVVVRCAKSVDIDSINVKLEGESRTRLLSPGGGPNNDKPRPQLEYHKILYKVQTVFPPAEVLERRSAKSSYTLPPGQHEYPFRFKIPFNNTCHSDKSQIPTIGASFEIARPPSQHVKKTLPPTLSGFPGEAEIRYFVKATISRHSIFKENPRAYTPFNFIPIEPPRPASTGSEVYARQKHGFSLYTDGEPVKAKMKGIFGMRSKESNPSTPDAPLVSVDARLPEPAILTCNREIPLRILVKKLNSYSETVYLQSLQIALIGMTKIRAHEVYRTEQNSWVIMSKSNLGIPIGLPTDAVGTDTVLDDRMWKAQALPNTVAPSFETCNISRSYQLDLRIGLSYAGSVQNASKPQSIILPLRLDTLVYSGIAPPAQLLEAMAQARADSHKPSVAIPKPVSSSNAMSEKLRTENQSDSQFGANQIPPTPIDSAGPVGAPEVPARPGNDIEDHQPPMYSDAPPSYEDAMGSHLPPIDAARPEYAPPATGEDDLLGRDEKRGWVN